jgi:predicted ribosomally synthesized peptide with nif11-like leader
MSEQNVHEFLKKLEESPELRKQLRQIRDDTAAKICEIAGEKGLGFSAEELRKAIHDKWDGTISLSKDDDDDTPNMIVASERPGY